MNKDIVISYDKTLAADSLLDVIALHSENIASNYLFCINQPICTAVRKYIPWNPGLTACGEYHSAIWS